MVSSGSDFTLTLLLHFSRQKVSDQHEELWDHILLLKLSTRCWFGPYPPHLLDPRELLFPALLLAQLGDTGQAGVTGFSHVVPLLPGRQDVGADGCL